MKKAFELIQFTGYNDKECIEFCPIATDPEEKEANLIIKNCFGENIKCNIGDYIIKYDDSSFNVLNDINLTNKIKREEKITEKQIVNITIQGVSRTGKSTIMQIIEEALLEKGIEICRLQDDFDQMDAAWNRFKSINYDERIKSLRKHTKIDLKNIHSYRTMINV